MRLHRFGLVMLWMALMSLSSCVSTADFLCGNERCISSTQYCEVVENAQGAAVSKTCRTLPTTCAGANFCDSCLNTFPTRRQCTRFSVGAAPPEYTVSLAQ